MNKPIAFDISKDYEIGYIVGATKSDGSTYISDKLKKYTITLSVKDIAFVKQYESMLKSIGLHPNIYKVKDGRTVVSASSKPFVLWYRNFDINKDNHNTNFDRGFIEGFFDGDGWFSKSNVTGRLVPSYTIGFANTNLLLLDIIEDILTQKEIKTIRVKRKSSFCDNNVYSTEIHGRLQIRKFTNNFKPARLDLDPMDIKLINDTNRRGYGKVMSRLNADTVSEICGKY